MFWPLLLALAFRIAMSETPPPFDAYVPAPPTPVSIGGRTHLVHELHITNRMASRARLLGVSLRDRAGYAVATFDRAEVAEAGDIEPGKRAILYFWVALTAPAPDTLEHRVTALVDGDTSVADVARIPITHESPPVLGAPVKGGPWVAVYAPALARGHRRVLFDSEGSAARIPARFAIDFMRIDADGRLASGDSAVVANYYAYGADVLAVADGVVASVRDGVTERARLGFAAHGPELASGNFITVDIGGGRYVSYEHLKPGSVRVAARQRVKLGEVIAKVGFSGDGSYPHLHMHVSDGSTPMLGEGRPWVFSSYEVLGGYAELGAVFAAKPWLTNMGSRTQRMDLPAPNVVIMFPD
jgi:murein DD-endopeptidase